MLSRSLAYSLLFSAPLLFTACNNKSFKGATDSRSSPPPKAAPVEPIDDSLKPTGADSTPGTLPVPIKTKTENLLEKFVQAGKRGSADILIVIDDSGSMKEEQDNFSTKMNDLLLSLKDADWQIGIINTSVKLDSSGNDRCDLKLIKSSDANNEENFAKAVTASLNGASNEEGIRQAVNGLKCKENPWVRKDATVAVLILSDEDNCSKNGSDCPKHPAKSETYLIDYVEKDLQRTVGVNAGFYGIFSPPANHCSTAQNDGVIYQRLVDYKATGMTYGNICDASYKSTLEGISRNIATLLDSKFQLKGTPDQGSLVVSGKKANGDALTAADYSLSGMDLIFKKGSEPALGSEIEVKYSVTTTISP